MNTWKALALGLAIATPAVQASALIDERFDDANVGARDWYNLEGVYVSSEHYRSAPSSLEFRFAKGAEVPDTVVMRRKFEETDRVYLSFYIKYSESWLGSQQPQHPHLFYLMTNEDDAYVGPAETRLTVYAEEIGGRLQMAIQDALNIDQNRIKQDLTTSSENRSVAGCNGDGDSYQGRCYKWGSMYRNIKDWKSPEVNFDDTQGPTYKGDWHRVEAFVKLNTIADGKGVRNGQLKMWVDGKQIVNVNDALLRTARHPNMKFNQVMMGPFIGGGGSPVEQTMWVDDVILATERPGDAPAPTPKPAAPAPAAAAPAAAPAAPAQPPEDPWALLNGIRPQQSQPFSPF
jgi:hypothetical protein